MIDWEEFATLCGMRCTEVEIAAWHNMSVRTLARKVRRHYGKTFVQVYADFQLAGRCSLRRRVWTEALSGQNPAMLKMLAEHELGLTDKKLVEHTGKDGGPIEHVELTPAQRIDKLKALMASAADRANSTGAPATAQPA